ncbi:MAG: hypothetical protein OSB08_04265 [SAR324 cluster bacterium]|nr:hypothetical protein [SAR324 cluster bacterium]
MIARKPQKFSLNSRESNSEELHKESTSSISRKQQQKITAADTATSILEELGVKKSSVKKTNKNNLLNVQRKPTSIKKPKVTQEEWDNSLLKDLKTQKTTEIKIKIKAKQSDVNKTDSRQTTIKPAETKELQANNLTEQSKDKFGFQEKFVIFVMLAVMGIAVLGFIGGYLKIFDLAIFRQLASGNVHQLEFIGEFEARKVENGYNRLPLFVVEGSIRNTFFESDQVEKIQLKAFAFDSEQQMISSHFTFAGVVLSDVQLETLSPLKIKSLRHSVDLKMLNSNSETEAQKGSLMTSVTKDQEVPFQVVFFKDVSSIKRTSLQIVSYVRKNKLVYVRASDLQ